MGDGDCMSGAKEHAVPWSWIFPNHGATNQIKLHTVWMWCVWDWERERESKQPSKHTYNTLLLAYHIVDLGCWEDCIALMKCLSYDIIISDGEKNCGMELCGLSSSSSSSSCRLIDCLFVGSISNTVKRGWAGLRGVGECIHFGL